METTQFQNLELQKYCKILKINWNHLVHEKRNDEFFKYKKQIDFHLIRLISDGSCLF